MAQESSSSFLSDLHYVDDFYLSLLFEENQEEDATPVSDSNYAENLQIQEALLASTIINTACVCETDDHQTMFELEQMECEICADTKESFEMLRIEGCEHLYCHECISSHVATKIRDNIITVTCPGVNCYSVLEFDSCKHVLAQEVIELWEQARCRALIDVSQRYYCPFNDCSAMLLKDNQEGEVIQSSECPVCRRLFCAQCSVPWHDGIACEEYQRLNEDERGREDLRLRELANKQQWSRCPTCKFYVERTEGCPHITCRCMFQFCYGCGSQWTSNHSCGQRA